MFIIFVAGVKPTCRYRVFDSMEKIPQLVIYVIIDGIEESVDDIDDIEEPAVEILQLIADPKPEGLLQRCIGVELEGHPQKILRPPSLYKQHLMLSCFYEISLCLVFKAWDVFFFYL